MRKQQLTMSFVAAALAAGMMLGVQPEPVMAESDEPYVIWVNPIVGTPVFTRADEGFSAAAEELGFESKIIGPSILDETQYYEAFQSAIVENPDAIVVCPFNFSAFQKLYDDATEKGIALINISSDSAEDTRLSFIGTDNTKYGQLAADYINEKMNGEANVLCMMSKLDTSNQIKQRDAFIEKCEAEYPGIKMVNVDEDNADSAIALEKFKDNIKAHPEIDTIFCLESIGGVAAANACEELGRDDITILAVDDNEDTLQYIRDGKIWGTMAQNFFKMGYMAGEVALNNLNGEEVESVIDSGTCLITTENIDTYADEFYSTDKQSE